MTRAQSKLDLNVLICSLGFTISPKTSKIKTFQFSLGWARANSADKPVNNSSCLLTSDRGLEARAEAVVIFLFKNKKFDQ